MSDTMLGVVNYASGKGNVECREIPIPRIGEKEVLLEVKAVGVCGSDLHQYLATHSWKVNYPVVLGHEFAVTIVECGSRVKSFRSGDRVVSETAAVINENSPFSRQGNYHLDPDRLGFGYGTDGAMARYVKVPERCLHGIPANLDGRVAALTEPCAVAYNAVCVKADPAPGECVAIFGPGPIGLLCGMMARLCGAGHIVVIGLSSDANRLETAARIGAATTLRLDEEDPMEWVRAFGDGYGVDIVIDAAGASAALELALKLVRPGGRITKVGWGPQPLGFSLDPLVQKGVTLHGSFSHNWPMWERVLRLLSTGQLDLAPVLNRVTSLEDWQPAFEAMHSGDIVKAVLTP